MTRIHIILAAALAVPPNLAAQFQTRLEPKTSQAFDDYRKAAEARMDGHPRFASGLKPGQIEIIATSGKTPVDVSNGLIHDWTAATIAPGTTVERVLQLLQDYPNYKNIYRGDLTDSKLLNRNADNFHIALRMVKKKVLTVILDAEFDVQYRSIGADRWTVASRSTSISELDGDRDLAPGNGHGFLWNQNTYWLIEPRPEGVYMECRSLSLSRDIPFGLSLVVKPFVSSVPRESLQDTLEATLRALR